MKKLLLIFLALALLFASASVASATVIYTQTWEDETTSYITVDAGDDVIFLYESYSHNTQNYVETIVNLLFRGEADEPVAELVYHFGQTGTSGSYTINTTDFVQGHYIIQGTAYDVANGGNWTSLLEFFVYSNNTDTDNNPPYFLPVEHFVFDLAHVTEAEVLRIADYAVDPDDDALTFNIDTSATNNDVLDCALFQDVHGTLVCEFYEVGTTSLYIIASDGEFPVSRQVFITIINSSIDDDNHPPYFVDLERYYSYDIALVAVDVVDLADFAVDPDGDALTFALDTSLTNTNIVDCELQDSVLHCNLLAIGQTSLVVSVSDGEYTTSATIYITVFESETPNQAPYFIQEPTFVMLLEQGPQLLVDLDTIVVDPEDDTLYFSLVGYSQANIVDCTIASATNVLACTPLTIGNTTLTIAVTDGEHVVFGDVHIQVVSLYTPNRAPELRNVPASFVYAFSYNEIKTLIPDVQVHGYDPDGDALTYSIITSNTDASVVVCSLVANSLRCQIKGVGTTTLDLVVSDGQLSAQATITVQIIDDAVGPVAIIQGPSTIPAYDVFTFDGSSSTAGPDNSLIKYQWTIRNAQGVMVKRLFGPTISTSLALQGVYTVELLVVDDEGRTDTAMTFLTVTYGSSDADEWVSNRNLQINSIQTIGYDVDRANAGDDLKIFITITNNLGKDVTNMRTTFSIPEFGIRFKSDAVSLDDGDKTTLTIIGHVPSYITPGVYYPEVSVVAGDVRRAKIGYLEVTA